MQSYDKADTTDTSQSILQWHTTLQAPNLVEHSYSWKIDNHLIKFSPYLSNPVSLYHIQTALHLPLFWVGWNLSKPSHRLFKINTSFYVTFKLPSCSWTRQNIFTLNYSYFMSTKLVLRFLITLIMLGEEYGYRSSYLVGPSFIYSSRYWLQWLRPSWFSLVLPRKFRDSTWNSPPSVPYTLLLSSHPNIWFNTRWYTSLNISVAHSGSTAMLKPFTWH
jgi:hypothetical protein